MVTNINQAMGVAGIQPLNSPFYQDALKQSALTQAGKSTPWDGTPLREYVDFSTGYLKPIAQLFMRLGVWTTRDARFTPGAFEQPKIHIVEVVECRDSFAVFVVADGKPLIIEDEKALYPSDTLVSRINMLKD